jgi:hypothetical protein
MDMSDGLDRHFFIFNPLQGLGSAIDAHENSLAWEMGGFRGGG